MTAYTDYTVERRDLTPQIVQHFLGVQGVLGQAMAAMTELEASLY
jgi:hypothetical protein